MEEDPPKFGPSGLPEEAPITSLTLEQEKQFCDWYAAQLGGYGITKMCTSTTSAGSAANQAACLRSTFFGDCTVGDFEKCAIAYAHSDWCEAAKKPLPECTKAIASAAARTK